MYSAGLIVTERWNLSNFPMGFFSWSCKIFEIITYALRKKGNFAKKIWVKEKGGCGTCNGEHLYVIVIKMYF